MPRLIACINEAEGENRSRNARNGSNGEAKNYAAHRRVSTICGFHLNNGAQHQHIENKRRHPCEAAAWRYDKENNIEKACVIVNKNQPAKRARISAGIIGNMEKRKHHVSRKCSYWRESVYQ